MNNSDRFFTFPYKLFEPKSARSSQEVYEHGGELVEPDWVRAWCSVPISSIGDVVDYCSDFSEGLSKVAEEGFNTCLVYTRNREYECLWDRKTMLQKMDEHGQKWRNSFFTMFGMLGEKEEEQEK